MVYKPEMDKRAQRPKEQAQQGKDITRIADGQEKSAKSIENLIGQQKIANENLETGFTALMKSQKTSFIRRNLDNLFEIVTTRKEGKDRRKQAETFQKEHLVDDKKHHIEFKTSDKKTDLDYEIQRHQEDTGEDQLSVLAKTLKSILGLPENINKITKKSTVTLTDALKKQHSNIKQFFVKDAAIQFDLGEKDREKQKRWHDAGIMIEKWKEERLRARHAGLRVFGQLRVKAADHFAKKVEEQQKSLDEMKKSLDSVGKTATDSFRFRRVERKLIRREWAQAKASGSKDAEKKAKDRMREARSQTTLFRMAKGIGKMAGWMGKAAKTVAGKFPSFGKLLTMGIIGALFAFMNSPAMAKAEKFILKNLIPKFGTWYDTKFEPMFTELLKFLEEKTIPGLWTTIEQFFTNMGPIITDIGNIFKALGEGKLMEALGHVFNLLLDSVIMIIDVVGNILKSIGLVDFEGPSATAALHKGGLKMLGDLDNAPWWIPAPWLKSLRDKHLTDASKIADVKEQIFQFETMKEEGKFGAGSDVQTLNDLYKKLKELEADVPKHLRASTLAAAEARTTPGRVRKLTGETDEAFAFYNNPQNFITNTNNAVVTPISLKNEDPVMREVMAVGGGA